MVRSRVIVQALVWSFWKGAAHARRAATACLRAHLPSSPLPFLGVGCLRCLHLPTTTRRATPSHTPCPYPHHHTRHTQVCLVSH